MQNNINVHAAYLHILGDLIMSAGVVLASVIIYIKPEWTIADPICTYIFSVIVFTTIVPVVKLCIGVLMEGTPSEVDSEALVKEITQVKGVQDIHDFHLW